MADFNKFLRAVKKMAMDAVKESAPVENLFGTVLSVSPFQMAVDQKLLLTEEFVVIGRYVKEYSLDLTIEGELWHGLRAGDKLLLSRMQGGQKYLIIDFLRRVDEDTRPAGVMTGEVVSPAPNVSIKVNDYLTLGAESIILCENVKDYQVSVSGADVDGGVTIYNHLQMGDKVLLINERTSQKWYVAGCIECSQNKT